MLSCFEQAIHVNINDSLLKILPELWIRDSAERSCNPKLIAKIDNKNKTQNLSNAHREKKQSFWLKKKTREREKEIGEGV